MEELKAGWKTDFDDGQIEGEFMASIEGSFNPQCDVDSPNGLKISHNLVVELVISEEWAPNKKPNQATPTGAARVLRTQFGLNVTCRAGMGISWDDEIPPSYEDVPASPPHYQNDYTTVKDYDGNDLHEDVEQLNLES
jgi:arrestin-related trafficking adapter 1